MIVTNSYSTRFEVRTFVDNPNKCIKMCVKKK